MCMWPVPKIANKVSQVPMFTTMWSIGECDVQFWKNAHIHSVALWEYSLTLIIFCLKSYSWLKGPLLTHILHYIHEKAPTVDSTECKAAVLLYSLLSGAQPRGPMAPSNCGAKFLGSMLAAPLTYCTLPWPKVHTFVQYSVVTYLEHSDKGQ
jgi:hypothetical protein